MSSFMRRHFKWYGMICKCSGLAILHTSKTSESSEEIFSRNKLYLIYSVACLSVCAIVEIGFFYELWLAIFVHDVAFTTTIHVLLFVVVNAGAALNATLTFVKARCMQRFFCESSKYERRVRFVAPKSCLKPTAVCYLIRFLLLVVFAANLCASSYLSLEFVDRFGCGPALGAALKLTCIAGNFLIFVFDAASFLVLRPCCEVIRLYIEHQHGVLRSIVRSHGSDVIGSEELARLVERVRLNLCAVSHLKRSLNESWKYTIAASGVEVLIASCAGIYLNFVEEFWTLENFNAFLFAISTALDFLDITILSDAMVTEVREMRHTLRKASTSPESGDYVNQVLHLTNSLKPSEMALCGAGFFALKLRMLVSRTKQEVETGKHEERKEVGFESSMRLCFETCGYGNTLQYSIAYASVFCPSHLCAVNMWSSRRTSVITVTLSLHCCFLAGAVITYTVILVQTSESVKKG